MNDLIEFVNSELEKMPGFHELDDKRKSLLIVLASIVVTNVTLDWIFKHKEEIKKWIQ